MCKQSCTDSQANRAYHDAYLRQEVALDRRRLEAGQINHHGCHGACRGLHSPQLTRGCRLQTASTFQDGHRRLREPYMHTTAHPNYFLTGHELFCMQPAPQPQLTQVLSSLRHTFVVADATLPDCPLVYASEGCVTPQHTMRQCWLISELLCHLVSSRSAVLQPSACFSACLRAT